MTETTLEQAKDHLRLLMQQIEDATDIGLSVAPYLRRQTQLFSQFPELATEGAMI